MHSANAGTNPGFIRVILLTELTTESRLEDCSVPGLPSPGAREAGVPGLPGVCGRGPRNGSS